MQLKRKKRSEARERLCLEVLRVSTPKQVELGGLESQHEDCLKIAEFNKIKLSPEQIRLPGISGKNVKHTPEIARLHELLSSGEYFGVVMVEDTRLLRPDEPEDQVLLQVFKDEAITIFTKTAAYDMGSPEGMMIFQMFSIFGGRERRVIRQRTYSKRLKLRARGLCPSGDITLPHGIVRVPYRDVDTNRWAYAYDNAKISQVRRAVDLVIEGKMNFLQIARATGLSYTAMVRTILPNTAYVGYRTYDAEVDPTLDKVKNGRLISQTRVRRPDDEIERVPMLGADGRPLPPAIPPDLFWHAQKIIEHKAAMKTRRNSITKDNFLFRNFLRCARCGDRLVSRPHSQDGQRREYYICRSGRSGWHMNNKNETRKIILDCDAPQIRRERVEELLDAEVATKLRDPMALFGLLKAQAAAAMRGDNRLRIDQTKQEIAALENERSQALKQNLKGYISDKELDANITRIDAALKAAERVLRSLTPAASMISPEALAIAMAPFENWGVAKMTIDEKRALLTTVCPIFNVLIKGKKGRGKTADGVEILGVYVGLMGKDAQNHSAAKKPLSVSHLQSDSSEFASDSSLCWMSQITDQLNQSNIYIPF